MVIDSGRDSLAYHVNDAKETSKTRQLPVTLLSGFLVRVTLPILLIFILIWP